MYGPSGGIEDGPAAASTPEIIPDPDRAPVRLGHHVLLHKLGEGGMGVVYAAYDEQLDRRVAIKLLHTHKHDKARIRLIREAQALARLSHPNVVQIYDIGESRQRPFLIMELIEGLTLARWRALQQRSRAEILEVFLAAGRGLAAAHAKGLIHRDFKPENVMIRDDGQVVVMDFGLARGDERSDSRSEIKDDVAADLVESKSESSPPSSPLSSWGSGSSSSIPAGGELRQALTVAGAVIGTVGYMAPEQAFAEPTSDRCDQFSFCVALWEALYDRLPFPSASVEKFRRAVLSGELKPKELGDVPAWLRKVLERGLARSPSDRWPSMNELLDALQRDPTRRHRNRLAGAGMLALAAVGVAGWLVLHEHERDRAARDQAEQLAACEREGEAIVVDWNDDVADRIERAFLATNSSFAGSAWQHARPWLDDYADAWSSLRTQTCVETKVEHSRDEASHAAVVDCLDEGRMTFVGVLGALSDLSHADAHMVTGATMTAARLPPPSHCTHEKLLLLHNGSPTELRVEVGELRLRLERARARTWAGDHQRGLAEAQAVLDEANALAWTPLVVHAGLNVSAAQSRLGNLETAKRAGTQAFWIAAASDDELGMLMSVVELSGVLIKLALYEEAHGWIGLAKALVERLELAGTAHEAQVLDRLATIKGHMGKYHDTVSHQTQAVRVYEEVLGSKHPMLAIALLNLGNAHSRLGQNRTALDYHYRALEILQAAVGPQHEYVGHIANNIGVQLENIGDYEGALTYYQRAVAVWELAYGGDHPEVAGGLNNVGLLLTLRGDAKEALALHHRALEIYEAKLSSDHPSIALTYQRIGSALQMAGSHTEALEHHRRGLSIVEATLGPEHPDVLAARIGLGQLLHDQGNIDEALAELGPTLEQLERSGGHSHIHAMGLVDHGLALLEHGDVAAAREQLERAVSIHERDRVGVDLGKARFALARAVWASGEEAWTRTLVETARTDFVSGGRFGARGLAEVEAWLREHP